MKYDKLLERIREEIQDLYHKKQLKEEELDDILSEIRDKRQTDLDSGKLEKELTRCGKIREDIEIIKTKLSGKFAFQKSTEAKQKAILCP